MNIYKTKDGQYINMNNVNYIQEDFTASDHLAIGIYFVNNSLILYGDQAKAFLEYLDNHLEGVYVGSA